MSKFNLKDIDQIGSSYINSLLKINGINVSKNELENRLEAIFIFYKTNSLNANDMKFVENENFERLYELSMEDLIQESRELTIKDVETRKLSRGHIVKKIILEKLVLKRRFGILPPEIIELIFFDLTVREIQNMISVLGFTLPQKYYRIIKIIKGYNIDPNLEKKETMEKIIRNAAKECNIEVVKFVVEKLKYTNYQNILDEFGFWCEDEVMLLKLIEYIQIELTTRQKFNYDIIFYFSFKRGYARVGRYSLHNGADKNYSGEDLISRFYRRCDTEVIKFIIKNNIYNDYQDIINNFMCKSEDKYLDFIKYVEKKGDKEYYYDDVLYYTALNGYLKTFKYAILKYTASFSAYRALGFASDEGHLSIVRYITENLINIKDTDFYNPLNSASHRGHLEIVKYLVSKGAKPNKKAVESAVISNHLDVVKYLVNNGFDVSNIALETAAGNNNVPMFKFLFENGDFKYSDSVFESFKYTTSEEIKDFLIKNVDSPENILHDLISDRKENLENVKYLVESGVDIHGGFAGEQAICMAVYYGHFEIVKYLISKGANLSGSGIKSECIKKAKEEGYDEIIDYLEEVGEL